MAASASNGYPWESPEADLMAAEALINECGYHRRDEELADARRAILRENDESQPDLPPDDASP